MTSRIVYHQPDGAVNTVENEKPESVMRAAIMNGVPGIVGECGGQAMCATCHVYVRPEWLGRLPEMSDDEDEMLDCTSEPRTECSRLGCQLIVDAELSGIEVDVPESQI